MISSKLSFDHDKIATLIAEGVQKKLDSWDEFTHIPDEDKTDIYEAVHTEVEQFFKESNGMELD